MADDNNYRWLVHDIRMGGLFGPSERDLEAANAIEELSKELSELKLAIREKGGNEHAPTQFAYDAVCKALEKHRKSEDDLRTVAVEANQVNAIIMLSGGINLDAWWNRLIKSQGPLHAAIQRSQLKEPYPPLTLAKAS